jgi:hypothetical protein
MFCRQNSALLKLYDLYNFCFCCYLNVCTVSISAVVGLKIDHPESILIFGKTWGFSPLSHLCIYSAFLDMKMIVSTKETVRKTE